MACNQISKGINARCDTSMGGIVEVAIANYDDVKFAESTEEQTELTAKAESATWYKFSFRRGTSQMTSTLTIDDANGVNYVATELQMTFGKMETAKRVAIAALAQSELAVIVKDCNGQYWYLGETEPVLATAGEGATGAARGDSNHYSVTLTDNNVTFPKPVSNGAAIFAAASV